MLGQKDFVNSQINVWQTTDSDFIQYPVVSDGDCGYTAFGITRENAYLTLKDENNICLISDLIKHAICEALLFDTFFAYLKENAVISNTLTREQLEANDNELIKNFSTELTVAKAYINYDVHDKKIDAGWSHPAILQALAHIQKIELYIWQPSGNKKLIPHTYYPHYSSDKANNRIDLLFINGNHFDRLERFDVCHSRDPIVCEESIEQLSKNKEDISNHKGLTLSEKAIELHNKVALEDDFDIHGDDSSDEESVDVKLDGYDTDEELKRFIDKNQDHNDYELPFLSHAYGLRLLYSKPVNKQYYQKKKELLAGNEVDNLDRWLMEITISYTLYDMFLREIRANKTEIDNFFIVYGQKNIDFLNQILHELKENKRQLFLNQQSNKQIESIINKLHAHIFEYLDKNKMLSVANVALNVRETLATIRTTFTDLTLDNFDTVFSFTEPAQYTRIPMKLRFELEKTAIELAISYLNEQNALEITNGKYRVPTKKNGGKKTIKVDFAKYKYLGEMAKRWYYDDKLNASMLIQTFFLNPYHAKQLCLAYIKDLLVIGSQNQTKQEQSERDFYFDFQKYLNNNRNIARIERKILPNMHGFTSQNPVSFFSNLRINNRSQTRQAKQFKEDVVVSNEPLSSEVFLRSWQFNTGEGAAERQEITANQEDKTNSRSDLVVNLEKYSEIYKEIENIKTHINQTNFNQQTRATQYSITDAKIAEWIRKTLLGQDIRSEFKAYQIELGHRKKLNKLITNLTYLLFGTEVVRNPASLIIHQMMLDLIIKNGKTWVEMFCTWFYPKDPTQKFPARCPMSMDGAAPSTRELHDLFNEFMPFSYQYFGTLKGANKNSLISKEENLIYLWFSLNKRDGNLKQAIRDNLQEWYGLSYDDLKQQNETGNTMTLNKMK